jgi:hypothetical protein
VVRRTGKGAAVGPLGGAAHSRLWYDARGGPTRGVGKTPKRFGAQDGLGKMRGLGRRAGLGWRGGANAEAAGAREGARRRGVARLARTRFNLGYFEHIFLSKIELKCTK